MQHPAHAALELAISRFAAPDDKRSLPRRDLQKLRDLLLGQRRIEEFQLHRVRDRAVESAILSVCIASFG